MDVIFILVLYGIIVNVAGFAAMGIDKGRARRKVWRIPESTLFLIALIGGSIGSLLGMYGFRHKTRHWSFTWGMPAIPILQTALILYLLFASPLSFTIL